MALFGFFGTVIKKVELVGEDIWHVAEVIVHDADLLFIDTMKAAQLLGITKAQLYTAVERAKVATETYTQEAFPHLEAAALAQLQHEFVSSSLVQKFGLAGPVGSLITSIVSKLFASESDKLPALIGQAVTFIEGQTGLTPPMPAPAPSAAPVEVVAPPTE